MADRHACTVDMHAVPREASKEDQGGALARNRGHSKLGMLLVLLLLLSGAAFRIYFIQAHSSYMQSDEAIVGLMAKHIITRGQLPVFFYAEERNGALIAYLVAPFFYLFGASNLVFKAVTTVVSLVFAYLVYLLAKRIAGETMGLLALALTVFGPAFFVMWSVHASAQYLVMMVCGVSSLILCDEILFGSRLNSGRRPTLRLHLTYGLLGLVMGIGLWTSPSVFSFIGAVWIVLWLRDRKCFFRTTFLVFLLFFLAGNLPALLFNALPGLREAAGLAGVPNWVSYASLFAGSADPISSRPLQILDRLLQLITVSMPVMVGGSLWEYEADLVRRSIVVVLVSFWLVAVIYTLAARLRLWAGQEGRRRWELTSIDAPILQFLLTFVILAISRYGWLVREPRYLLPAFVFLPIAGACFLNRLHSKRKTWSHFALSLVLLLNLATSIWFSKSLDPDHGLWPKDEGLIQYLIDNGIQHPVANYWIAYSIAFESDEKVIPVPIGHARFGMYQDVLNQPAPTYYIFRKREKDDPYFGFFRYGLVGPQWTSTDFADHLQDNRVPATAYEVFEFDHYVLYDVPRQYLDSAKISSPDAWLPMDHAAEASQYLAGVVRPGDALVVNPPGLLVSLGQQQAGEMAVYPVPAKVPLDGTVAGDDLARIAGDHPRLFALFGDTSASDPAGFVESWLNRNAFRAGDQWIGDLRLVVYGTGAQPAAEQASRAWGVRFGEGIELAGSDLAAERLSPGEVAGLTLFWRAREPVGENLKVFVHLLNGEGQLVAQRDSEPVGGLQPTSTWGGGESIIDRYGVLLPGDLSPGEYQLVVGLYDPATGERVPVLAGAEELPDDALPLETVQVGP